MHQLQFVAASALPRNVMTALIKTFNWRPCVFVFLYLQHCSLATQQQTQLLNLQPAAEDSATCALLKMSASAVGGGWDERMTDNKYAVNSAAYQGCNLVEDDMADIEAEAAADDDSNEIPVWVRGEARWIGGVTEHTTAADLVEALLLDDRSLIDPTSCTTTTTTTTRNGTDNQPPSSVLQQFVITERWRQMEQILEPKTNVWKIWRAWGEAQNEVG